MSRGCTRTFVLVVLASLALAGCATPAARGGPPAAAKAPPAAPVVAGSTLPTIEGAKAVAQEEIKRYGAGDAGGAWDLLDTASQAKVSRADYVAVHDACPLRAPQYTITGARLETPTQAVITVSFLITSQAYNVNYEGGRWRWQMRASDAASYAGGAAADIARMKKAGVC